MTFSESRPLFSDVFPSEYFDSFLKRSTLKSVLNNPESFGNTASRIPSILSSILLEKYPQLASRGIIVSTRISLLTIEGDTRKYSVECLRELLESHVQKLTFQNCSLPSAQFCTRDSSVLDSPFAKLDTLILKNVSITLNSEFLQSFSFILRSIKNFSFSQIKSSDSSLLSDEIFFKLAREYLSKNPFLRHVDLRNSGVDLMTPRSRRNVPINFPAEMRRWSRKIRSLAFESEVEICKIFRILHRQTPVLSSLCIKSNQPISECFDRKDKILAHFIGQKRDIEIEKIEPLNKLKNLCFFGYYQVNNEILRTILRATTQLKYLNISGCSVSFEHYCNDLPQSLSHLIIDQCDRKILLEKYRFLVKQVLKRCSLLIIYISDPIFDGEDRDIHDGLVLMNGTISMMRECSDTSKISLDFKDDDGLKAFETRIISLNHKSCCMNIF